MSKAIEIEGLTKVYDDFVAVDSLTMCVERNRFVGFLGPNGAGKSTTIKMLTSLTRATKGKAYLNGVDVVTLPKSALSELGTVVETPEFYPYLTPNETLAYMGELHGMNDRDIKRRTKEVLDTVRMSEWADKRIGKFSKGMKQRVAIAQAILHEPSIVILDEPTSGLDPRGIFEVREVLFELKSQGYTIFMSSHMLNEVQEVCDEVALINRGKLLRRGPVEELVRSANVRRLEVRTLVETTGAQLEQVSQLNGVTDFESFGPKDFALSLAGTDEVQAGLLDEFRRMGLRVVSFKDSGASLEGLYMSLIEDSR
jgi:ABC-2 type transport system ATP-binding protein